MRDKKIFKRSRIAVSVAATLSFGAMTIPQLSQALGTLPGFGDHPNKYLIAWMGDQMLDGNNVSPLDGLVGVPDGTLPDADFVAVINADPFCVDGACDTEYGEVVNTAEMPASLDASTPTGLNEGHLLSESVNFVNNAIDLVVGGDGTGSVYPTNPNFLGVTLNDPEDIMGGVPNAADPNSHLVAPVSILNESHHMNVKHLIHPATGARNIYPSGLISANTFGCDITDPMNIKASPGSDTSDFLADAFSARSKNNLCGLTVAAADVTDFSGTDDLLPFGGGHLIATFMGAKGTYNPVIGGSSRPSLPPVLTTPGGLVELDGFATGPAAVVGQYVAIPTAPVAGHGTFSVGPDSGTNVGPRSLTNFPSYTAMYASAADGEMLGPKRYQPRKQTRFGGQEADGWPVGGDTLDSTALRLDGVVPFNNLARDGGGQAEGGDTGLLAHPHGIGIRPDLSNAAGGQGIVMASDYADPVSLALTGSGAGPGTSSQDLGTTARFWNMSNMAAGPYAISQMPDGPRVEENQIHEEPEGLMAMAVTNRKSHKGAFVASMCGGAIYYSSDITVAAPEFKIVYDFGACVGASVFTVTRNDRYLVIPISGIQTDQHPATNGGGGADPIHDRDFPGEHDMRIVTLSVRNLLAAGDSYTCDAAEVAHWDNTGVAPNIDVFGNAGTEGPASGAGVHPIEGVGGTHPYIDRFGDNPYTEAGNGNGSNPKGDYWPNNGEADCPFVADVVYTDGLGQDGLPGTADDHPDNETSRGGPHYVAHDDRERYAATSHYFVDLREFAISTILGDEVNGNPAGDIDTLLGALGLGRFDDVSHAYPPGVWSAGGVDAPGGLAHVKVRNGAPISGEPGNGLPGTGSIGDDTICMMKLNRWTGSLDLDPDFNKAQVAGAGPTGCIDMDFGDAGQTWPQNGAGDGQRAELAGNATPHAITFITVNR